MYAELKGRPSRATYLVQQQLIRKFRLQIPEFSVNQTYSTGLALLALA